MFAGDNLMDKSEIYIKMCDCPEIQGQWESEVGDFYFVKDRLFRPTKIVDVYEGRGHALLPREANYGWLPRQDQIQEMLGTFIWTSVLMEKCFNGEYPSELQMDTWEKRWLHLYMQNKHQKIWDGKKWIKKNEQHLTT